MKKNKVLVIILTIFLIFSVISGCTTKNAEQVPTENKETQPKDVLATYQNITITASELATYKSVLIFVSPLLKDVVENKANEEKIIQELMGEKYLYSEAIKTIKKEDFTSKTNDIVNSLIDQHLNEQKGVDKETLLKNSGVTVEELNEYVARYLIIEEYLKQKITADEITKYYNDHKEEYLLATVQHVLIGFEGRTEEEAKKRAEEVLAKLKAGEDFAKIVKEYSDDPGSKEQGGIYTLQPVSQWVPEFKQAAITLPINQLSDLVKTNYGYHIIKVLERKEQPVAEVKDQITLYLVQEKYTESIDKVAKEIKK